MTKKRKFAIYLLLISGLLALYIKCYYWGALKYEFPSPNGQYTLKYYQSNQWLANIVQVVTLQMEKCSPEWVRLYDHKGDKIAEDRVNDCLPGRIRWNENDVSYATEDGYARWSLPTNPTVSVE